MVLRRNDGSLLTDTMITVSVDPVAMQREIGELAAREGWTVLGLATKAASLEDVFLHLVREEVAHV